MLVVDMAQGKVIPDEELKSYYARRHPYGEWLDRNVVRLGDLKAPNHRVETHSQQLRDKLYKAFGYTYEDIKTAILPMARTGSEQTAAMGIDIPLAVLSDKHQPLFNYFKQSFAQVTNPPIDAIREKVVTSTTVYAAPTATSWWTARKLPCAANQQSHPYQRGYAENQGPGPARPENPPWCPSSTTATRR